MLLNIPPTRTRVGIYVTFGMENEVKKWRFAMSWINEQRSLMTVSSVFYTFFITDNFLFVLFRSVLSSANFLSLLVFFASFLTFFLYFVCFSSFFSIHLFLALLFLVYFLTPDSYFFTTIRSLSHLSFLSFRVSWLSCYSFEAVVRCRIGSRFWRFSHTFRANAVHLKLVHDCFLTFYLLFLTHQ